MLIIGSIVAKYKNRNIKIPGHSIKIEWSGISRKTKARDGAGKSLSLARKNLIEEQSQRLYNDI